jgi:hypothetical protein
VPVADRASKLTQRLKLAGSAAAGVTHNSVPLLLPEDFAAFATFCRGKYGDVYELGDHKERCFTDKPARRIGLPGRCFYINNSMYKLECKAITGTTRAVRAHATSAARVVSALRAACKIWAQFQKTHLDCSLSALLGVDLHAGSAGCNGESHGFC